MRLLGVLFVFPAIAFANQLGVVGYSGQRAGETCNNCHSGGGTPTVRITGPSTLAAGQTGDFTLTITGGAGTRGGMNVSVDVAEAALQGVSGSTTAFSNEVHQSAPKAFSGGSVSFPFKLVAPPFGGTVKLFGAGNSVNGNGGTSGDRAALTTLSVTVTGGTTAPRFATPAAVANDVVTAATVRVSALGADDQGEAALTYSWELSSGPAPVTFSPNGTNAAKQATATFQQAGEYVLQVTVRDASSQAAVSRVNVSVQSMFSGLAVAPAVAQVLPRGTRQFTATAQDQFGKMVAMPGTVTWNAVSGGNISPSGLFTAGGSVSGPHIVQALAGGKAGTASISVVDKLSPEADMVAPTVALSSHRAGATLTGVVTLQVTASDDVGVAEVEFLLDGKSVAKATGSPWSATFNSAAHPNGAAKLEAVARDAAGNEGRTGAVDVLLQNSGAPSAGGCSSVGGGSMAGLALALALATRRQRARPRP